MFSFAQLIYSYLPPLYTYTQHFDLAPQETERRPLVHKDFLAEMCARVEKTLGEVHPDVLREYINTGRFPEDRCVPP